LRCKPMGPTGQHNGLLREYSLLCKVPGEAVAYLRLVQVTVKGLFNQAVNP
jgi:hypothetical protein